MDNQISLEQAIAALREQYGHTYDAGYEDGKKDMERTLEHKFQISSKDSKAVIEGLIEARTIRWASNPDSVPNPGSTMGVFTDEATWFL